MLPLALIDGQQLLRRRTALLWMLKFLSHKSSCAALRGGQDVSSYFCCFAALLLLCSLLVGDGPSARILHGSSGELPASEMCHGVIHLHFMQHLALHIRTSRACRNQLELSTMHAPLSSSTARFEAWRDLAPAHLTQATSGFSKDERGKDDRRTKLKYM